MAGLSTTAGTALRASDPVQLGPYKLLRRLGEGGMGSVYLAEAADHTTVALKVIRADLAEEPEFRRRFRSEVTRAQQVPPFCTAEVLDADPDHETPYLVVEYVDGPSLSEVVTDRGPLTQANLYGLAIGVATALTAIHGAGVIHRDLKPSNVLLAPGTPKVIDFGIARATEGSDGETRTDQLMGTVAYMAPERLDPAVDGTLTPAADIFAWGAVVTYAATGHVPFVGDTSPATAIAILTQKPNLDGVSEPLRALVRRALAKKPASRPTARELLDELLSNAPRRALAGSGGPVSGADAANARPCTAVGARARDQIRGSRQRTPSATEAALAASVAADTKDATDPDRGDRGRRRRHRRCADVRSRARVRRRDRGWRTSGRCRRRPRHGPGQCIANGAGESAGRQSADTRTVALRPADATEHLALAAQCPASRAGRHSAPVAVARGRDRHPRPLRAGVGRRRGRHPDRNDQAADQRAAAAPPSRHRPRRRPTRPDAAPSPTVSASPTPSPSASARPPDSRTSCFHAVYDHVARPGSFWHRVDSTKYAASCLFSSSGMTVSLKDVSKTVSYRCSGPQDLIGDMQLSVNVTFVNPDSCGAIWFRFVNNLQGYVLRCAPVVSSSAPTSVRG